jgi:hypothetical protein
VVDKFDFREMMQGPQHVSQFFRVTVGSIELDGLNSPPVETRGILRCCYAAG